MADKIYTVRHNGKIFDIKGPPGATHEQLMAALSKKAPAAPVPTKVGGVEGEMAKQASEDLATGLQTGLAKSITKTVRGVGTTVLPKVAETYLEAKGILPTAEDVKLLEAGTEGSTAAQIASGATDVATDLLPYSKAMKGVSGFDAIPRGMVLGGTLAGVRAEGDSAPSEAVLGTVSGGLGAVAPVAVGGTVGRLVNPSLKARNLMNVGVAPSLGEGVETGGRRYLGKTLNFLENQLETMPISGVGVRAARRQPTEQLFREAAELGVPPGRVLPQGSRPEVVGQLLREGGEDQGAALAGTTIRATPAHKAMMDSKIDALAPKYGLSQQETDLLKMEMNKRLWAGTPQGTFPGQAMENVKEDLFLGNVVRGNSKLQAAANELGGELKDWTNKAAQGAGFDLPAIRQAQVNANVLRRAGGSETGVSGPRLMKGVEANDAAMGATDTASREMRDLAENASIIAEPRSPWGSRNLRQLAGGAAGEGALSLTGGLGHIAAQMYGAANASPWVRKLLMGDPVVREQFVSALRAPSVLGSIEAATDNQGAE